jgi:L-2-hydroxyglutarate oxidase LhgO
MHLPSREEAEKQVQVVTGAIIQMSAGAEEAPTFSIIDVARHAGVHPALVAAVVRYNPSVRELYQLLSDTVTSELLSRYLNFILHAGEANDGFIEVNGRSVPVLTKDQVDAVKFFLQNSVQLSPSTGMNTETELAKILGFRSEEDAALDLTQAPMSTKLDFLKGAIKALKGG